MRAGRGQRSDASGEATVGAGRRGWKKGEKQVGVSQGDKYANREELERESSLSQEDGWVGKGLLRGDIYDSPGSTRSNWGHREECIGDVATEAAGDSLRWALAAWIGMWSRRGPTSWERGLARMAAREERHSDGDNATKATKRNRRRMGLDSMPGR